MPRVGRHGAPPPPPRSRPSGCPGRAQGARPPPIPVTTAPAGLHTPTETEELREAAFPRGSHTRSPPSAEPPPFTARKHPSTASRSPRHPSGAGSAPAALPRRPPRLKVTSARSSPRGSSLPTAPPRSRAAPGSRSYLSRQAEPSRAEPAGAQRRPLSPLSGGARGVGPRTAPPSCAGPLRCGGRRRRSLRLSGAAASGEPLRGKGGRAAPLPSPPRCLCRPQRRLASPPPAGQGLPSAGRGRRRAQLRQGCGGRAGGAEVAAPLGLRFPPFSTPQGRGRRGRGPGGGCRDGEGAWGPPFPPQVCTVLSYYVKICLSDRGCSQDVGAVAGTARRRRAGEGGSSPPLVGRALVTFVNGKGLTRRPLPSSFFFFS